MDFDPSWPYLAGIYHIFYAYISNSAVTKEILEKYVTPNFIKQFLDLFDSNEAQEREILKHILHKLYVKLGKRRRQIRK